uniref:Uncharacterized protein n=1 Tax=Knipowitschia caucasica TaxID=637954 RepID=A0AAV2IXT0_KNICA
MDRSLPMVLETPVCLGKVVMVMEQLGLLAASSAAPAAPTAAPAPSAPPAPPPGTLRRRLYPCSSPLLSAAQATTLVTGARRVQARASAAESGGGCAESRSTRSSSRGCDEVRRGQGISLSAERRGRGEGEERERRGRGE